MKILRVHLKNFRGVEDRSVEIEPCGVTIIEGPNEIGKTSIAEAIDLIFTELDSSTKQHVKRVQPVLRDVGPEVEIELETGPYHVIYFKRWIKDRQTTLRILRPSPDNIVGRPAHVRMQEILDETLDASLWRALRCQQGQALAQAAFGDCTSLAAALDAAAGGSFDVTAGAEGQLWERVEQERLRYFTATGRATKERTALDEQLGQRSSDATKLRRDIEELDEASEELRSLTAQMAELESIQAEQREAALELEQQWRGLERQQQQVELLKSSAQVAQEQLARIEASQAERQRLGSDLADAEVVVAGLEAQIERDAPSLQAALNAEKLARDAREELRRSLDQLRRQAQQARHDADYFRKLARLEFLRARHERLQEAIEQQDEARRFIDGCRVTEELVGRISALGNELIRARAVYEAESPGVVVEGLSSMSFVANGDEVSLEAGERAELPVNMVLDLEFPDVARVQFSGGSSVTDRDEAVRQAEQSLDALLDESGIAGENRVEEAHSILRERQSFERKLEIADETLRNNLEGMAPDEMAREVERLENETREYPAHRSETLVLPTDRLSADARQVELDDRLEKLVAEEVAAQVAVEESGKALNAVRVRGAEFEGQLSQARAVRSQANSDLDGARATASDAHLEATVAEAAREAVEKGEAFRAESEAFEAENPDATEVRLANARDVLSRTDADLKSRGERHISLRAELNVKGESGLYDQLEATESQVEALGTRKTRLDRQARAAALLHSVMGRHREEAKQSYVAPLKEQIEKLGRIVFGPSLSVELDEQSLTVDRRSLNGVVLPFDSLSSGAKEQLDIISRLACAQLVNRSAREGDQGAPVIIDDALGYSDPGRLESLGAVLSVVGRNGQVVILTCMPDRYRHVGSATTVQMGRNRSTPVPVTSGAAAGVGSSGPLPPLAGKPIDAGEGAGLKAQLGPTAPPGAKIGSDAGDRVRTCLASADGPLGKSDILEQTGLDPAEWGATIKSLLDSGQVTMEGQKRGARYRVA
jgi:DNA repair exonuclease SbcCD ATPase subunit